MTSNPLTGLPTEPSAVRLPELRPTNMVVAANLDKRLNLLRLAGHWHGVMYNMKQTPFCLAQIRTHAPDAACLIYPNGVMASMGSVSTSRALVALHKAIRLLRLMAKELGDEGGLHMAGFHASNFVFTVYMDATIDLEALARMLGHAATLRKPFPGIRIKCSLVKGLDPPSDIAILLFKTSKGNVVNAKSENEAHRVTKYMIDNYFIKCCVAGAGACIDYDDAYKPKRTSRHAYRLQRTTADALPPGWGVGVGAGADDETPIVWPPQTLPPAKRPRLADPGDNDNDTNNNNDNNDNDNDEDDDDNMDAILARARERFERGIGHKMATVEKQQDF